MQLGAFRFARPTLSRRFAGIGVAVRLVLLAPLVALLLLGLPTREVRYEIPAEAIAPLAGHAYAWNVPRSRLIFLPRGDEPAAPRRSTLRLFEDDRPLGVPHGAQLDIETQPGPGFVHAGRRVVFTPSDNSDPRANGRRYHATAIAAVAPLPATIASVAAVLLFLLGAYPWGRSRRLLAAAPRLARSPFLAWGLIAAGFAVIAFLPLREMELPGSFVSPRAGHAFVADIGALGAPSDDQTAQMRSPVRLFENGRPLGPAHALHNQVEGDGLGRYSHWGTSLIFSSTDNSDPRRNGRLYRATSPRVLELWGAGACVLLGLGLLARLGAGFRPLLAALAGLGFAVGSIGVAGLIAPSALPEPINENLGALTGQGAGARDYDLIVYFAGALVGAAVAAIAGGLSRAGTGALIGCCAAVVLVVNIVFLGWGAYWIVINPDSTGYLEFTACRSPGYTLFLRPFLAVDPRWIVIVQLNLLLAALVGLSLATAYCARSSLVGIATLVLGLAFGEQFAYAFHVLTEAPFMAAFAFTVAGALVYLRSRALWSAALVGASVAVAMAIKSAAPVLIVPAALLLLLPTRRRLSAALLLIAVPFASLAAQSLNARIQYGQWSPTNLGGAALIGHVAQHVRPDPSSAYPELSATIHERVRRFHENWPPLAEFDAYFRASTNDYNAMLWGEIWPVTLRFLVDAGRIGPTDGCVPEVNSVLMTLSREAIAREPARFVGHVAAHYYGLWRLSGLPVPLESIAANQRHWAVETQRRVPPHIYPAPWRADPQQLAAIERAAAEARERRLWFTALQVSLAEALGAALPWAVGLSATILALGMVVLHRIPPRLAAPIIVAGFLAAYLGIHALFQVALFRYTAAVQLGIAAYTALIAGVLVYGAWRFVRRGASWSAGMLRPRGGGQ